MKLLAMLFGRNIKSMDLDVKFHTDTNLFGEHGTIVVSHKKKKLVEQAVRFVFPGITTPPKLDLRLMAYVWEEARNQGFIPHHLQTYGLENDIVDTTRDLAVPDEQVQVVLSRAKDGLTTAR